MIEDSAPSPVDRYLSGEMSPSEEREFLERHGNDPEVRARIDADRRMRRGITSDRSVLPMPASGSRARMIAMLDALPPEPQLVQRRPSDSGSHAVPSTGASGLGSIVSIAAALGLAGAIALMIDRAEPSNDPLPPAPAAQHAPFSDTARHIPPADTILPAPEAASGTRTASPRSVSDEKIRDTITVVESPRRHADTVRREKATIPVTIEEPTINGKHP
jgi:anti-sigma factor RsiW